MTFQTYRPVWGLILLALLAVSCNGKMTEKSMEKNRETASASDSEKPVKFVHKPKEKRMEVWFGDTFFTNYMYPENVAKPILYPLSTTGGKIVTRGFPIDPKPGERADHPHHVGLWLNYGNVNGLDFWNNPGTPAPEKRKKYGFITHRSVEKVEDCPQKNCLEATAEWKTADGKVLLLEKSRFSFRQQGTTRSIIRTTTLTAQEEVSFSDNKEGMIAIRVIRALELPSDKPGRFLGEDGQPAVEKTVDNEGVNGNYLSSEGGEGAKVWGTRAKWMKLHGQVEGAKVAIVILDHPDNVGYPTYWHARGYGLFSANPLGQKIFSKGKEELNFKLDAGKSTTFKYKILIHEGEDLTVEQIDRHYQQFTAL